MKRIILLTITILALLSCLCIESALSFSGATHRILSYYAALNSVLNKENYLSNYLGFQNGLQESFKWADKSQTVSLWLQDGAVLEDQGMTRSYNHFHNPLKEWANAGLDDYLQIGFHLTGKSALLWAQDGDTQSTFPGGDWSWQAIRDIYYVALVSAAEQDRQAYFAILFRGLGHQMHLIQDMAVPSHARNDAHPEQSLLVYNEYDELFFEPWAARNRGFISNLAKNPRYPTVSLNIKINNYAPITQLTDANQYGGSNPSGSTGIGLAEYTNANFFSDDTIFASEIYSPNHWHYFPYPNKSSTDLQTYLSGGKTPETIIARDGVSDTGIWLSKTGDDEQIEHFVKPTYLSKLYYLLFGEGSLFYGTFYRDEVCHADYASALVPRATGYSAALLDYFFRGKLEMAPSENGSGYVIENKTEEDMDGTFELYYDATDNQRKKCWGGNFALGALSSGNNKSDTITFTTPDDAKEPDKYILVFQGRLGHEDDAVIGNYCTLKFGLTPYVLVVQDTCIYERMKNKNVFSGKFYYVYPKDMTDAPYLREKTCRGLTITIPYDVDYFKINGKPISQVGAVYKWDGSGQDFLLTGVPATWEIMVSSTKYRELTFSYNLADRPDAPTASFGFVWVYNWKQSGAQDEIYGGALEREGGINTYCQGLSGSGCWYPSGPCEGKYYSCSVWGEVFRRQALTTRWQKKRLAKSPYLTEFSVGIHHQKSQRMTVTPGKYYRELHYKEDINVYGWNYSDGGFNRRSIFPECIDLFPIGGGPWGCGLTGIKGTRTTEQYTGDTSCKYKITDGWWQYEEVTNEYDWGEPEECQSVSPPGYYQCSIDLYEPAGDECVYVGTINETGTDPPCWYSPQNLVFGPTGQKIQYENKAYVGDYHTPEKIVKFEMQGVWNVTQWLEANNFDLSVIPETVVAVSGYQP